jgi:hypothetical protein
VPTVFLDIGPRPGSSPRQQITEFSATEDAVSFAFNATAGFHDVLVLTSYGAADPLVDVLPGHDRHIAVGLCGSLTHYDSFRSVSVVLPTAGLTAYLEIGHGEKTETRVMTVDDGVAYAEVLGDGSLTLMVHYGSNVCSYQVDPGGANSAHQHLRLSLSMNALSVRGTGWQCGKLDLLSP